MGQLAILLPLALAACAPGARMGADNGDDWDFGEKLPPVAECSQTDGKTTLCADGKAMRRMVAAIVGYHESVFRKQPYSQTREVIKHIDVMQIVPKGGAFDVSIRYAYGNIRSGQPVGTGDSRSTRLFTLDSGYSVTSMGGKGSGRFVRVPKQ
ncbi:hypothetical protein A6A04_19710 [Paramagnetospirillum marisnigri]|uniref:Lipoprotein n=2 Tax=Paramagnetospirillum marisnigri TaxID=1285242 RepID=A0A178ML34_9PROT|nr:hypothetical protein A6A04_19710 [Paramagnetospirillum marisnigri]